MDSSSPGGRVILAALTEEARDGLGASEIEIRSFPFRVGRESRRRSSSEEITSERRKPDSYPSNDLYFKDAGASVNVSKEHFLIDRDGNGYVLVDRRSTLGTIVNGERIGGQHAGGQTPLNDGDVIVVGTSPSPYRLEFRLR